MFSYLFNPYSPLKISGVFVPTLWAKCYIINVVASIQERFCYSIIMLTLGYIFP